MVRPQRPWRYSSAQRGHKAASYACCLRQPICSRCDVERVVTVPNLHLARHLTHRIHLLGRRVAHRHRRLRIPSECGKIQLQDRLAFVTCFCVGDQLRICRLLARIGYSFHEQLGSSRGLRRIEHGHEAECALRHRVPCLSRIFKVRAGGGKIGTRRAIPPALKERLEAKWAAVLAEPTGARSYEEFADAVRRERRRD